MRRLLGLVMVFIGLALMFMLNRSWRVSGQPLPPMGNLLNPTTGVWKNVEKGNNADIDLSSPDLTGDVRIVFDERMVPHIFADNLADALFAQGYVEAYHRLFQMDISTRSPEGTLSEIFGEALVEYDRKQRRLGLPFAAENAVRAWERNQPEDFKTFSSYVNGINHYIGSLNATDLPFEYKLLDFKPTEWSAYRSALMFKAMTQTLAGYEEDIEFSNAYRLLGETDFRAIFPEVNPKSIPVIQQQSTSLPYRPTRSMVGVTNRYYRPSAHLRTPQGIGSNNWALSGERTASGYPMLANDPHLELSLPSVWYEIEITTPEFSAHGVTLLGMPGIMIGFNQDIAWGETNVGFDVMDYHRIHWANAAHDAYWLDGKERMVRYRVEKIKVKGSSTVVDSVQYTQWGPIVEEGGDLALRWLAHDTTTNSEFMTFVHGMTCSNYDDYLEATSAFHCPAQNFIYADRHGTIGLRVNGSLPQRMPGQGRMITEGDSTYKGWNGFIPREENPQERNPVRGFVSSNNQRSAGVDYPYYYWGNFEPYRGRIMNERLRTLDSATAADMKALQNSNYSLFAEEALPLMLMSLNDNQLSDALRFGLPTWNYHYDADSKAATFYEQWMKNIHLRLWDEVFRFEDSLALPAPEYWVTIQLMEQDPQSRFWDVQSTPKVEDMKAVITWAFDRTQSELGKEIPMWGVQKPTNIPHLTFIPALSYDTLFIGGHRYSLNAMQKRFGPSWRMIVELGDEPVAYVTYPGGQSGNPVSPYYSNRVRTWANGEYSTVKLMKEQDIKSIQTISIKHEE